MRKRVFEELAAELHMIIEANSSYELPAITELAAQYRVSYQTMWKAVNCLVKAGVLVNAPGRKHFIASRVDSGDCSATPQHLMTSAEKLAIRIKNRIASGEFEVGKPLPKADAISRSEGISRLTVAQAMVLLQGSHLVHKAHHRWVAGAGPVATHPASRSASQSPVVLVLFSDEHAWSYVLQNNFMSKFIAPFASETLSRGVSLAPALLHTPIDGSLSLPSERDGVKAAIRALGTRYQGTLLIGIYPKLDKYDEWITMLSSFDRPVVYFDNADAGGYLTRRSLGLRRGYYRLHVDERAVAKCGVEALTCAGHRCIGIHGADLADWAQRRTDLMIESASRLDPAPRIVVAGPSEDVWDMRFSVDMHHVTTAIALEGGFGPNAIEDDGAARQAYLRLLAHRCRSLTALLVDHAPTALVGLNDRMAREYFFLLKALGVVVPRDVSLISFDNTMESLLFPISSVDFGLARLGYCAAHIFIGDIPVRADRQGCVAGVCTVADRGSIGAPSGSGRMRRILR